jgi:hypothetical protein
MFIRRVLAFALFALATVPCACAGLTPLKVKRNDVPPLAVTGVQRVVLLILENGSPKTAAKQDFMKLLEQNGTRLDRYFAVAHPSQNVSGCRPMSAHPALIMPIRSASFRAESKAIL